MSLEKTYRLEFNEKKQQFHLDNFTHEENTHGWETIIGSCTDVEYKVLESYINRVKKRKITKAYLDKCIQELTTFSENLINYKLMIVKI
jgi:hypothetical protein